MVVDMQQDFNAANGKSVVSNCKKVIKQAMLDDASIIFLEYNGCGPTKYELFNLTDGYANTYVDIKDEDDGSLEVAVLIRKHKLNKNHIKVCGVNTDCCVASTVRGLTSRFLNANIEILASACASDWNHPSGLSALRKMPNVNVRV